MRILKWLQLSAGIFLCSCTHYYYVPNTQNVPLFREKNEYRISSMYAGGEESGCFELQTAYSITDKIGVQANFMTARGGTVSDKDDWGKGSYIDAAIGFYKPVNRFGVFEVYGGVGGAKQHHHYMILTDNSGYLSMTDAGRSSLSFMKVFVQPSYGVTFKGFDIAGSARISTLTFFEADNKISGNSEEYNSLRNISGTSHLFLEPAVTIRGGWKYVKLQLQASTGSYLNKQDRFEGYHIGFGLYISIAERFK